MVKKILLSILIFFVVYILLIFKAPIIAWSIEQLLWIKWFNDYVIWLKSKLDKTVINIPSQSEVNIYDSIQSWALDIKTWIDYTKDKIDWFRKTMSGVDSTIKEINDWYDKTQDFINTNSWVIEDARNTIDSYSWITEKLTNIPK